MDLGYMQTMSKLPVLPTLSNQNKLAPVWIQFQHETHSYSRNTSVACAIDQV
jgi:hypothetical protein